MLSSVFVLLALISSPVLAGSVSSRNSDDGAPSVTQLSKRLVQAPPGYPSPPPNALSVPPPESTHDKKGGKANRAHSHRELTPQVVDLGIDGERLVMVPKGLDIQFVKGGENGEHDRVEILPVSNPLDVPASHPLLPSGAETQFASAAPPHGVGPQPLLARRSLREKLHSHLKFPPAVD
ncbi:hypothetical protein F5148DRAFT_421386 [Russula earlei]|uniref:Uncharacterized protein n=1 Tax=Russula earlei TaxID=71964 RepID=A0ACC0UHN7_9AGAM|nr:hypothetical protein F5148DRAFT_421386 [Russula earlei]